MNSNFFEAPCSLNPCQNGGLCYNFNNNTSPFYSCVCANGYKGNTCQTGKKSFEIIIDKRKKSKWILIFLKRHVPRIRVKMVAYALILIITLVHIMVVHVQVVIQGLIVKLVIKSLLGISQLSFTLENCDSLYSSFNLEGWMSF